MKNFILLFIIIVIISAVTSYFVVKFQSNVRFVSSPKEDNKDYGYLEVDGKRYYQLYTTTQINIGNGLHYHRIDLRSSDPAK